MDFPLANSPSSASDDSLTQDVVSIPDNVTPPVLQSERVGEEIVTTERSYVKSLEDMVKGYKEPILVYIRSCGLPVAEEDVSALFGNIEELLALNSDLLKELETCGNNPTRIAEAFVTRASDFSVYSAYCTNYPRAVAILTLWQHTPRVTESSPKVTQFLKLCQTRLHHALPLGAFLIKPVQRILKYHLLLRELAKSCEKETKRSHTVVQSALTAMSAIADRINTMKRRHEAAVYIQEIQSQLSGWEHDDLSSYGDLLLEDNFKVKGAKTERRVFLFRSLLLLVKKKGEHLLYKGSIKINSLTVRDFHGTSGHTFVVTELSNQDNKFELEAHTDEIKTNWTTTIKRLMLDAHSPALPEEPPPKLPRQNDDDEETISQQTESLPDTNIHELRRGSNLSRRNAVKGQRLNEKPNQKSLVNIRISSSGSDDLPTPDTESGEVPTVVNVRQLSSRESTPTSASKKTKLTINARDADLADDAFESVRLSENNRKSLELLVEPENTSSRFLDPNEESRRNNRKVVEEVMEVEMSVGVSSGVDMTEIVAHTNETYEIVQPEAIEGDQAEAPGEIHLPQSSEIPTETTEKLPTEKPVKTEAETAEETVRVMTSNETPTDIRVKQNVASETSVTSETEMVQEMVVETIWRTEETTVEETTTAVQVENRLDTKVETQQEIETERVGKTSDKSITEEHTGTEVKSRPDEVEEEEIEARARQELVKVVETPAKTVVDVVTEKSTRQEIEKAMDTDRDPSFEQTIETKAEVSRVSESNTPTETSPTRTETPHKDDTNQLINTKSDVKAEDKEDSQPVVNETVSHTRRRRTEKESNESERDKETASVHAEPISSAETRIQPCNCLPFVVVCIALFLAILVYEFVGDLNFYMKLWLLFLPSAALLLMTVTEVYRRF
ncbi:pleckstrin homology domain-containing family G member 3-like isoform X1 [Corticium candelabrum]|uniref:pleckstrin homology domain-containing family G member 3-like isoform X1 n=1 Tax=Corticium candelabrum TaxID=121492 RepID=UPI002E262768|nr:pleckstrin homology domain-containing family G member 3-like isoform X1 [Corticium candelabrum]